MVARMCLTHHLQAGDIRVYLEVRWKKVITRRYTSAIMEILTNCLTCPKCHGSRMSFKTEQKDDGFTVSWTPCDCSESTTLLPVHYNQVAAPVFL